MLLNDEWKWSQVWLHFFVCQWFSGICVCTKWYRTPHSFLHSLNHCTWMVAQSLLLNQEIWRCSNIPRWRSTFAKLFALNPWWRFTSPYDHLVEFGTSWEVAFMDNLGCMQRQGIPPCQVSCPPIGAKWWCMDGMPFITLSLWGSYLVRIENHFKLLQVCCEGAVGFCPYGSHCFEVNRVRVTDNATLCTLSWPISNLLLAALSCLA